MQGKNRKKARTKWPNPSHENVPEAEYLIQDPRIRNQTISRWLCTKFSGIRFAEEIEPAVAEDVLMGKRPIATPVRYRIAKTN